MSSICGADCDNCGFGKNNNCQGCLNTKGCPFGKQCFVAKYILTGGKNVPGMPKIEELTPLNGTFVNLSYPMPNGKKIKLLEDDEVYLGSQVESEFNDGSINRVLGVLANMNFILISEYGPNGDNPEIIIYKKR